MKDVRRIVVKLVIGSFSLAALLGIIALLAGGDMDGTQGHVLTTTLLVGAESIAVLCYLSTAGTKYVPLGLAGALVSAVPFGISLWLVWAEPGNFDNWVWKTSAVGVTIAASIAQACLLLAVARGVQRVRTMLVATLLAIGVVAGMIVVPIVAENGVDEGAYWRIFGIIAILDVLGTITVAALARFGGPRDDAALALPLLSPAVEARLIAFASRRGVTPSELVDRALDNMP